ncbi:hypothetical protein AAG570_000495 [Ranatra chinensis]|uniref:Chitin-binding type-2 domain-containing protein n=1 Tax=Ranatra chinensis TaxID=642074 RepID=A0ABD0YX85_9HEMI
MIIREASRKKCVVNDSEQEATHHVLVVCSLGGVKALRGSALVLQARIKAEEAKLNPPVVEETSGDDGNSTGAVVGGTTAKPKPQLTGIPQKDYIYDPNLPRELKGHDLSNYPFYNSIPKDIEFECDGLHDGFYASVPHHCQVYHHCLFGTRYDFLCANYTAFDQKTFICHFVSEVDCDNSPKYYNRNEALYKAASTAPPSTTKAPTTTTTTTTPEPPSGGGGGGRIRGGGGPGRGVSRRRRPHRRRRPSYEYYYDDDEEYDDQDYYEDDLPPPRKMNRKRRPNGNTG